MKRLPIARAKEIAERHHLDQVILVAWDGKTGTTHVVTYGTTLKDCDQAALGGERVKRALGWPESLCRAEPSRVQTLRAEAAELRSELKRLACELNFARGGTP